MISPKNRFKRVMQLVEEKKYFTLHAGRQTGKTTSARWLVDYYNKKNRYCAIWVDIQTAREKGDTSDAMPLLLEALDWSVEFDLPTLNRPDKKKRSEWLETPEQAVLKYLRNLAKSSPKPLVVLFDEADGLVGPAMVSFLTQLRAGYISRSKAPFPQSLALIGMRQVRDYVMSPEERKNVTWLGTTSPFNITAEASTLEPFSKDDVSKLLTQHTAATGQTFQYEAWKRIYDLSQGHPWLVNAIADQIVNRDVQKRSVEITTEHVEAAKETIIIERRTHIDSLIARLRESRVQRIIEPMILGCTTSADVFDDDFNYVFGLGLVKIEKGICQIANPIYREVIIRALSYIQQIQIQHDPVWYIGENGSLDVEKLMTAWQKFWRKDGHLSAEGFHYREAGPHLMLMAFLQRIINGGGRVEREYGLGRGALDLMIFFGDHQFAIEVKLRRSTETKQEAIEQIVGYLDKSGLKEGWLILFDLRANLSWDEKIYNEEEKSNGQTIHIIGC